MALVADLRKQGWYINTTALEEYFPGIETVDGIVNAALNIDLKLIGAVHIPDSTWKSKTETINGPLVLQLQKLRNVCMPRDNSDVGVNNGPQLLRLTLTDGQQTFCALDMDNLTGIGINTPPGSKLKIVGKANICNGHLLLFKANCKFLGGHVQNLVDNWNLKRSLSSHNSAPGRTAAGDGGAPPFIPFGQRGKVEVSLRSANFKSLDVSGKKKEADTEFEQQRRATIEAALQQQSQAAKTPTSSSNKQQSQSDKDIATMIDMGFSIEQATAALKQSSGNIDLALNSLLAPDTQPNRPATNGRIPPIEDSRPSAPGSKSGSLDGSYRQSERSTHGNYRGDPSQGERTGGRRGGRGGRSHQDREEELYSTGRPSAPATLFDFVTSKMPNQSVSVTETEADQPPPPPSSSSSDRPKSSVPATSSTSSSTASQQQQQHQHATPAQLPPRLQKKQQQAEEEKYLKYYKPMDYMRQTNAYHRTPAEEPTAPRDARNTRRPNPSSADTARRVHDIHSRGAVKNKTLWTDEAGNERIRSNGQQDNVSLNNSNDAASGRSNVMVLPNTSAGVVLVTSANSVTSLESAMSGLNLSSSVSGNVTQNSSHSQPSNSQQSQQAGSVSNAANRRWKVGDCCLAKYWQDNKMYKAKITSINGGSGQRGTHYTVLFTDYGNSETVSASELAPLHENTWEIGGVYGPRDNSCIVTPVTLTAGPNIIYQPSAIVQQPGATIQPDVPGRPETTAYYYTQPYVQMTYEPAHTVHVSPANLPQVANCPVPGILVQGPPSVPMFSMGPQQTTNFQSNDNSAECGQNTKVRRAQGGPQVYIPPAQRK